jgi:hypothetical protein
LRLCSDFRMRKLPVCEAIEIDRSTKDGIRLFFIDQSLWNTVSYAVMGHIQNLKNMIIIQHGSLFFGPKARFLPDHQLESSVYL